METNDFRDGVAVITGAASGMGLLAAQRFIAGGAAAVLVDADRTAVEAAASALPVGRAMAAVADVRRW
ncbi:MAG: SDR family NAD(P)-dependent oxidoreductase, partial [Planctomycetes bacterium]|nr:SDR family NAD(P)-dependent oxidoreductase [Planctomycetota bacterium]